MRWNLSEDFLSLYVEKNNDGTRNLRLKGNELQFRYGKRLKNKDMEKVSKFVSSRHTITKLDLAYNPITDEGLTVFIDENLFRTNSIEHLVLVGCDIVGSALCRLCAAAATLRLVTLRLAGNKLTPEGTEAVSDLILLVPTLEYLDVGDTGQTLKTVPYILENAGSSKTLRVLDVSSVQPHTYIYKFRTDHFAKLFGRMLWRNSGLVELHLQKCQLEGHDVEEIVNCLRDNKTVQMLDVGYNRLGCFGAEVLAKFLKSGPPLQGLNIAGNSIGDFGAYALCDGLPCSKVKMLDISQNRISDTAFALFLASIKKTFMLKTFLFWGNDLGPKSIEMINRHYKSGIYCHVDTEFFLHRPADEILMSKYPMSEYKPKYYCQLKHNEVRELKIVRNKILEREEAPSSQLSASAHDFRARMESKSNFSLS